MTDFIVQLHRQFGLAQYLYNNISEEDKERLLFHPDTGVWSGYKHPYGFKVRNPSPWWHFPASFLYCYIQRHRGPADGIEQFNWYKPDWEDINRVPKCLHPFMDEIEAFSNYLTKSVNRRLLTLFSRVLELPDDYLWDNVQSHGSPTGEGYFRHALFRPVAKETEQASKGLRMHGHTDFGLTTLLFSVPISCLQIWGRDEQWYYVPYRPGALVINIGDTLEIVSGGHFKATRHRVFKPPADQLYEERLSLVLFNSSVGDLRMQPAQGKYIRARCVDVHVFCFAHTQQTHRLSNAKAASKNKEFTRSLRDSPPKANWCRPTSNGARSKLRQPRTQQTQCVTESVRTRCL